MVVFYTGPPHIGNYSTSLSEGLGVSKSSSVIDESIDKSGRLLAAIHGRFALQSFEVSFGFDLIVRARSLRDLETRRPDVVAFRA